MSRPYISKARGSILDSYDQGVRRMLVNMATGTGKTHVFSHVYEDMKSRLPGQMMVLAHRDKLIKQAHDKVQELNPTLNVQMETGDYKADPSTADVIVASIQTVGRKGSARLKNYNWETMNKFVIDEAHHAPTDGYRNFLSAPGCFSAHTNKLLLGVTATPKRADGTGMSDIFEKVAYVYSLEQAIADGYLVDIRGYRITTTTSLHEVKTVDGDFSESSLAQVIDTPARNQRVVNAWKDVGEGRKTVVFCANIEHAQHMAEEFKYAGVKAEAIWGDDLEKQDKYERHASGETTVLCTCQLMTEGHDDPEIGCVIIARPTQSSVLYVQMVGRATRILSGVDCLLTHVGETKRDCIVIDIADNNGRHSLCLLPTIMGLPSILNLKGDSLMDAVALVKKAQEQNPNVNFGALKDLADLQTVIENFNMFEMKYPAEVEENSEFTWFKFLGGYVINLPDEGEGKGQVTLHQNLLDQWEINGQINGNVFQGTRKTMEEAIKVADEAIIKKVSKKARSCVNRTAKWNGKPASPEQTKLLNRLYPGRTFPGDMTRGQASRLIGERIARKAKVK